MTFRLPWPTGGSVALWALSVLSALLVLSVCSLNATASTGALTVQTAVTTSVKRWSDQLVTAYRHDLPAKWTPPAAGISRGDLQVVGLALSAHSPGGTWVLEDVLKKRLPGGVLLPDTSDSIAVRRIGSQEKVSYFAQVSADAHSSVDHAWAISIEDRDATRCGKMHTVSELPWCAQGPLMTTRSHQSSGEQSITLAQWRLVQGQIQGEINAALQLAPIRGPVLPNLPQQFFPESY